jgi:hypothetical protein
MNHEEGRRFLAMMDGGWWGGGENFKHQTLKQLQTSSLKPQGI